MQLTLKIRQYTFVCSIWSFEEVGTTDSHNPTDLSLVLPVILVSVDYTFLCTPLNPPFTFVIALTVVPVNI